MPRQQKVQVPVYDCHPHDWDGSDPIGFATTAREAAALLRSHYAGTGWTVKPNPRLGDVEKKGVTYFGWWDAGEA